MRIVDQLQGKLRRWYHQHQIEASLQQYRRRTGRDAESRARYAEAGSFRSQVDRLFDLGSPGETAELQQIATGVVSGCFSNRYYRPADCLADIVGALEGHTVFGSESEGEPPLETLDEQRRKAKLAVVIDACLVPLKVAAIEGLVAGHAEIVGRSLPYAALGRFERQVARVFALVDQSEVKLVGERLRQFLLDWKGTEELRSRFREPADGLRDVVALLEGEKAPADIESFRVRLAGQPLRLSTVVPEGRQHLLDAALEPLVPASEAGAKEGPGSLASDAPPPPPAPEAEAEGGAFSIVLDCPKCGASYGIDDETVSLECEYCGSLLIVSAPERDEIYLENGRIEHAEELLEIIIDYRVSAHRAEVLSRYVDRDENPPPEWLVQKQVEAFRRKLLQTSRLLEARCFQVPYWQITGKIVQMALGRIDSGPKQVRVRAFAVEHTVPGYDVGEANLRDRGLRLARARVRPLTLKAVASLESFLPWVPVAERSYRELEKWLRRELVPGHEAVVKQGEFLFGRRVLVYRPYWLASVIVDRGPEWVLVDGPFRTIAGYPARDEAQQLLRQAAADPLHSGEESFRQVHVVPARCPDCGFEQHLDRRFCVTLCPNCHLGLEPTPGGIRLVSYDHASSPAAAERAHHLPFWRYRFSVRLGEDPPIGKLEDYVVALFPDGVPADFDVRGDSLWVPASRLLGTPIGDQAFKDLCESIHRRPPAVSQGKIPLGRKFRSWGVSLPEAEARRLARFVLMGQHSKASAARLNGLLVRRGVLDAELGVSEPRLVWLPFQRDGSDLVLEETGARMPLLLLEGGPQLEALKASVHQLQAQL